jgi:hypothetical protein
MELHLVLQGNVLVGGVGAEKVVRVSEANVGTSNIFLSAAPG